jgi:hypothetical protein
MKFKSTPASLFSLCLTFFLALGCSSSAPVVQEQQQPKQEVKKERKAPLSEYEATLRPSDYDQEVEVVQKVHVEEKQRQQLEIPKDSTLVQEEVLQGFRIQIFSSASIDDANAARTGALARFAQDSVYVVYDPPVYKVRVGDFVNRYEANQRLPEFGDKGYKDAWVVPDRVVQRKLIFISQPQKRDE